MAAAAILKIGFFGHNSSTNCPISAKFCTRKQNGMSIRAAWQKLQIFKIQDGGRPPFWKWLRLKSTYLSEKSSNFDETWYTASYIALDDSLVTKNWNFYNLKMAAAAILKIAFSAITHRSIVRFQRNFLWGSRTACRYGLHDKNCKFFKIQDGRRPPFWKWLNRHISVKNRPILMKLGTLHQILNLMTVKWRKIEFFKIQDGGVRHLENRFSGHYSSTDCPISAKFCMSKQNGMLVRATGQKNANF